MTETGIIAFLQQAHQNNWQQYLASLKPDVCVGWDVCVLTAADERQAAMYRRQLDWRRETGLLPPQTRFWVLPDPDEQRIGSGGATLRALSYLTATQGRPNAANSKELPFSAQRILIIHSGGDSKRLPHCSAIGKLFARVPRILPDGRASTIFDEFLISLSGLTAGLPPGVLVASGDVLLVFDHLQLSFQRNGVIGVAAAAPADMGQRHGVYVSGDGGHHRVRAYLHKPSPEELARWDAVAADGTLQIDTGLAWLDSATAEKLVALTSAAAVTDLCGIPSTARGLSRTPRDFPAVVGLNLYGDLLLPLAESTTYERYLADISDGPATQEVQAARQVIWRHLRDTQFTVERLQPAVFVHFGTSQEYWRMAAGDPELARVCGWTARAATWVDPRLGADATERTNSEGATGFPSQTVLIDSAMGSFSISRPQGTSEGACAAFPEKHTASEENMDGSRAPALVVDSHLQGPFFWQGPVIVANVETSDALMLEAGVIVDQLPVVVEEPQRSPTERRQESGCFVTRVFGLEDDPKQRWDTPGATFMNQPWGGWLAGAGVVADQLWPDVRPEERTLWTARLYPLAADREDSLRLSLPLQDPARAPDGWQARWLATSRLSMAETYAQADGERLLAQLMALEDRVAARRFCAGAEAELPAVRVKELLGIVPGTIKRRSALAGEWLAGADPVLRLRGYEALAEATGDLAWEDHAFSTLAAMIQQMALPLVSSRARPVTLTTNPHPVRVEAAARIDFGGGWTDTPPHSIERGGTVLNAAVILRGAYPVVAEATRLSEPRLVLESRDIGAVLEPTCAGDILAYADPADPFALHKAALVLRGIVPLDGDPDSPVTALLQNWGSGLRLSTRTDIPRGSGLGTSSIMAGVVLECLGRLLSTTSDPAAWGVPPRPGSPVRGPGDTAHRGALQDRETSSSGLMDDRPSADLFDEVLCLEQMLTTGGGWQDQVGGLTGGIKLVTTGPGLPQRIDVAPVRLLPLTAAQLAGRLLLVYTGQQRLAKNLLRHIMARWMGRDPEMVWILGEIARLAVAMRDALESDDLDGFGALLGQHWELNKRMDPGCTNPFIDELFHVMRPYITGGKLAGAGGGGFAIVIARHERAGHDLAAALATRYPGTPVGIWSCAVPDRGLMFAG